MSLEKKGIRIITILGTIFALLFNLCADLSFPGVNLQVFVRDAFISALLIAVGFVTSILVTRRMR
jgi:hypothetical protein